MDLELPRLERPELVVPGVLFTLVGLLIAVSAISALELDLGFENPRDQYLVGAAAIFAGVYMLDRVYGFVGR